MLAGWEFQAKVRQRRKCSQRRQYVIDRCVSVLAIKFEMHRRKFRGQNERLAWRGSEIAPQRDEVGRVLQQEIEGRVVERSVGCAVGVSVLDANGSEMSQERRATMLAMGGSGRKAFLSRVKVRSLRTMRIAGETCAAEGAAVCFCSPSSSRARIRVCLRVRDATLPSAASCFDSLIAAACRRGPQNALRTRTALAAPRVIAQ